MRQLSITLKSILKMLLKNKNNLTTFMIEALENGKGETWKEVRRFFFLSHFKLQF